MNKITYSTYKVAQKLELLLGKRNMTAYGCDQLVKGAELAEMRTK